MSEYVFILGVPSFANYEASAALIRVPKAGGDIDYVCIGEDRLTRLKHTYMFPLRGIEYCLRHFGLESLEEVDYIATDYARVPRWLNSGPGYRKLEHDYLKAMLKFPRERILIFDHHDAHAASCYYPSGFEEAGVLIVDGMGSELNTQTAYHFCGNEVTWLERGYDWGVGRLYSFVTGAILPYGPEKGYGKLMGLAPYGANHPPTTLPLAGRTEGMQSDYSHLFTRYPISRLVPSGVPQCTDRQKVMDPPFPRIAFEAQDECENQLLKMAAYVHEKTGTRRLCISGGVALNGRANYRILRETPIEEVWIQPACSDTGIPFGLALWAWFQHLHTEYGSPRCSVHMRNAYCGSPYLATEIDATLDRYGVDRRSVEPREVAELLAAGKIVALFDGGSEYGPRALGHRSILADPRDRGMFDYLNSSIKFREAYRPYAPVVLEEHVSDYFEYEGSAPFMLLVADVKPDKRDVIPAVTHVDGTARIQTVTAADNGIYYEVVKAFHDITGVPVLINTSFNVNREPIVETPLDSLICAFSTSIDYLFIEKRLIECKAYRNPELVNQMRKDRERTLARQYSRITEKHLHRYNHDEMQAYLKEENEIAEWHRRYRAKYELEKAMIGWSRDHESLLIVGTRNHTKCLYLYIPDFPSLKVHGFVPFDETVGEDGEFSGVYHELALSEVPWNEVSAILISSHEHQRLLSQRVKEQSPAHIPVVTLYDDACDSLLHTLPGKWPVMNPSAADAHKISMAHTRLRTASNIDFDFAPAPIDIGDRYAVAINYHLLHPRDERQYKFRAHETPQRFTDQLARLNENFTFSRARDLLDPTLELPESSIVLTFDDGAKDVILYAAPILKRFDIPASVFVCAQPYLDRRLLDVHKIELLMGSLGVDEFRKRFYAGLACHMPDGVVRESLEFANGYQFYRYDTEEVRRFKLDLNYTLPYEVVNPLLDSLFAEVFGEDAEPRAVEDLYLSRDELKRLADQGLELGVHTYHHRVLPRLDFEQQKQELEGSMDFLRDLTGAKAFTVAYPYGFADQHTKRAMKDLGLLGGFTMGRRLITPQDIQTRWDIPRYDVNDCFHKKSNEITYDVFSSLSTGD